MDEEEWAEAELFESEQRPEGESSAVQLAAEGLTMRTPSLRSLHSEATAANSPSATASRSEEDGKAGRKKRAFAPEELVFALDGESSDEDVEPEAKQQALPSRASESVALAFQRGDFQPPHTWCQSLPAHATGCGLPSLPGSVYEGRGRKLTGTSAMRLRMSVLRQTGFLEETSKEVK
ncbi:hypothetical protein WJX81_001607 [Elliptochloris bilobata]|uniref:Uncharacterized protein n=1 Tax=Elliptochloris bilobata TaxID=381761 RepID=A0AAW1QLQ0_9CHLO